MRLPNRLVDRICDMHAQQHSFHNQHEWCLTSTAIAVDGELSDSASEAVREIGERVADPCIMLDEAHQDVLVAAFGDPWWRLGEEPSL